MSEARRFVDDLFIDYHRLRAEEKAGTGVGEGARPAAGMARGDVDLFELTEVWPDGTVQLMTPLGRKTARNRLPKVLSELAPEDGRRRAAELYAASVEALGASGGTSFLMEGTSGAPSDGGVIGRQAAAERVRECRRALDAIDPFPSYRLTGKRRKIAAMTLAESVCVHGRGLNAVLSAHGWSGDKRNIKALTYYSHLVFDHMAFVYGYRSIKPG